MNRHDPVREPASGRRLAHWVWALGLLSLLGGGGYLLMLREPQQLPVRVVAVEGTLERLSSRQLRETVAARLDGGLLTQDLAELKAAVEAMPWVRSASLRRHWPDRLELRVVERVALARWGEDALVDSEGVVFKPEDGALPRGLPRLSGADEEAPRLVKRLLDWGTRLRTLALEIEALTLDARGAWTLHLGAGFSLALGKAQVRERIARFIRVYPVLAAVGQPSVIDMRYSNGLAIRWAKIGGKGRRPGAVATARSATGISFSATHEDVAKAHPWTASGVAKATPS
ncbi:MAG: cell division protein FtsQ/DivIB [Candidatus Thiosymbion ectosymbiont of Robbea hypermnestra]|nr:cell division protein FtsQ/DivIB [Candidatus Thiosymbion ectosymbiont of Robbea hypermnestra]